MRPLQQYHYCAIFTDCADENKLTKLYYEIFLANDATP